MSRAIQTHLLRIIVVLAVGLAQWQSVLGWSTDVPIVTYWGGPELTDQIARQAVAGGYNLVWCWNPNEAAIADRHGLRSQLVIDTENAALTTEWLDNPTKKAQLDAKIAAFRAHPSAYSYFVYDEPRTDQFSDLNRLVSYLHDADPQRLGYVNLLPTYAFDGSPVRIAGTTNAYNAYLNGYVDAVQPSLLSYDHYSLANPGDTWEYLLNLQLTSTKAHQAAVPFMQIVQASTWGDPGFRVPAGSELRYLVYSTLAYGAQGISYFKYRPSDNGGAGGLVDASGTTTEIFDALTPLNREFVKIASQVGGLRWLGTYQKGYRTSPTSGYRGPPGTVTLPGDSPFDIADVQNNMSYVRSDPLQGILFGLFDADGSAVSDATYAIVVNLDYSAEKVYCLTGPEDLSAFDATTGRWMAMGSNEVTLHLPEGGGVLVALTSAIPIPEPDNRVLLLTGAIGVFAYGRRKLLVQ